MIDSIDIFWAYVVKLSVNVRQKHANDVLFIYNVKHYGKCLQKLEM